MMHKLQAALLALISVFAPVKAALATTGVLIFVDLAVGLLAAHKRGEKITSSGLRRTLTKIFVYELAICMAFLAEKYLTGDAIPACKLVTALVGVIELKSVLESLDAINGTPVFGAIIQKLGSKNDNL